uniref:Glycosyltransferase 2-like domain-containing protein n=1 Tax=viral metagenome TaxID=1070528 RepID=A0A6C0JDJ0_9ZZZZ
MTKNTKTNKAELPLVSVCTPTFNRRPFIQNMFNCFLNQTYPKNRIEWIIVDDGTDKIRDLIETSNIPQIRYFEVNEKMTLGAKRNFMHSFVRGSIIVYMDDDDYYPPERIEDAVEKLTANPKALCAGSSEIYIYFKHIQKMYQCGPYGPNHATAGTFAFRKELLEQTKYEEHAALAEERAFLKEYTIPFVQLDPLKSILVFSHEHNTYDKRKMLDNQHPNFFRESDKTVDMFIRQSNEQSVKDFFLRDIDELLANYEPGLPNMKPDVLKQIKEIEAEREQMLKEEMAKMKNNSPIMIQRPGQEPKELTNQEIVDMIQDQQSKLAQAGQKVGEYENMIMVLQKQLIEKTKTIQQLTKSQPGIQNVNVSSNDKKTVELENMVSMLQKQLIEKTKTIRELNNTKTTTNDLNDLAKQNIDLQAMIGKLQQQLVEKTIALRDSNSNNNNNNREKMTRIPIQLAQESKPANRNKTEPEIFVDINAI